MHGAQPSPFLAAPSPDGRSLVRGHDAVVGENSRAPGIRRLVQESWQRSLELHLDPDHVDAGRVLEGSPFGEDDLRHYRDSHPMALVLPTIHNLLIRHTFDAGLIVAVGDESGRLLWIDGDRSLRRKAENMLFVEGADWSEHAVGTSAPGTALALDHGIQIRGAEHFNRIVHPWSCTAVPVHDPKTGAVLGVIDITGGDDAVAPATLPLLEAAVRAAEAELWIRHLETVHRVPGRRSQAASVLLPGAPAHIGPAHIGPAQIGPVQIGPAQSGPAQPGPVPARPVLSILGSEGGRLAVGGAVVELSLRHAEILTVLAWHTAGLSAERLAALVYEHTNSELTLRAEMVRLRKVLASTEMSGTAMAGAALVPLSRPYRLPHRLDTDAGRVLAFLDRGAHKVALGAYGGAVLPTSTAPGVVEIRGEVSRRLRDALLTDASVDTLLAYARTDEAAYDAEVWSEALRLLPAKSPKRAMVVARLERIERELR